MPRSGEHCVKPSRGDDASESSSDIRSHEDATTDVQSPDALGDAPDMAMDSRPDQAQLGDLDDLGNRFGDGRLTDARPDGGTVQSVLSSNVRQSCVAKK